MVALVSNVFLCNFPSFDTSLPSSNNCQREFFKCWNIFLLSNNQFFIIYNFTYIFVSIHLYMALIIPNIVCDCDPVIQIVFYNTIYTTSGLWRGIFNFHEIYFLSHSHLSLMHTITITMIIIVSTVHQCTTLCFDKQPRTNNQFSHWPWRFDHNFMTFRDQRWSFMLVMKILKLMVIVIITSRVVPWSRQPRSAIYIM